MASETIANGDLFPRGFSTAIRFPWPLVRAEELVLLNYGKALREGERRPGKVRVYGTNGQCGWHDKSMQEGPGVILGRKGQGPLGVEWCNSNYWVIDTAYFVTPKTDSLHLKYFYYIVKYIGLNHLKDGTSNPSLSRDTFNSLLLPFPPIAVQKNIARILSTLDDKIELNRRMNETLEMMARAIFKGWFVDFDPIRAKMDGRKPAGMDAATAAQFPDSVEESELGLIPKGWKVMNPKELMGLVIGGDWGKDSPDDESTKPVFCIRRADIPDLQSGGTAKMPIRYVKPSSLEKRVILPGDVVIEISGGSPTQSTGRPVFISTELLERVHLPIICSNFCRLIRPTKSYCSYFLYLMLRHLYYSDEFLQFENGTTGIKNFAFTVFCNTYKIIVPVVKIQQAFNTHIESLFALHGRNGMIIEAIAAIRDTLLPKLMSGELRINEAEKFVEARV